MLKVNNLSVGEVVDYLDDLDDAYSLFEEWLKEQSLTLPERKFIQVGFDVRFSSLPYSRVMEAQVIARQLGTKRASELDKSLKQFVLDNELMTEEEYAGEE